MEKSVNPLNTFRAESGEILAIWKKSLSPHADSFIADCWKIVDGERCSSATGIHAKFLRERAAINADTELSSQGKARRIQAAAEGAFGGLVVAAELWHQLSQQHGAATQEALGNLVPAPSVSDTLVDLALGQQLRSGGMPGPTVLELKASTRLKHAIARLPTELTGVDEAQRQRLLGSLVDHETALRTEARTEALEHARDAIQQTVNTLTVLLDAKPSQTRHMLGGEPFKV